MNLINSCDAASHHKTRCCVHFVLVAKDTVQLSVDWFFHQLQEKRNLRSFTNHLIMACSANLLSYAFLVIFLVMLLKFSYRVLYLFDKLLCWILQATNTKSEYTLFHLSGEHFFMQTCKHVSKLHTNHLLRVILQNPSNICWSKIWRHLSIY